MIQLDNYNHNRYFMDALVWHRGKIMRITSGMLTRNIMMCDVVDDDGVTYEVDNPIILDSLNFSVINRVITAVVEINQHIYVGHAICDMDNDNLILEHAKMLAVARALEDKTYEAYYKNFSDTNTRNDLDMWDIDKDYQFFEKDYQFFEKLMKELDKEI